MKQRHPPIATDLPDLFENAARFFLCNTDRQQGKQTSSGKFVLEQRMRQKRYAAAWEPFAELSHMKRVERGDAVFMYANRAGIIAVGCALSRCEKLLANHAGRLRDFVDEKRTPEWRVPVRWLVWVDDPFGCPRKQRQITFLDVTSDTHRDLREAVKRHFLG